MKTIYPHDDFNNRFSPPRGNKRLIGFGVLIAVCLVVVFVAPVRAAVTRTLYIFAPSLWDFGVSVGDDWNSFWGLVHTKQELLAENASLRDELSRDQALILDRNMLMEEVLRLEETLGRDTSSPRVLGRVLEGSGSTPYDTLIIDVGSEDGLVVDDVVTYAGNGAIGAIAEVYPHTAKVRLYSSPGQDHNVLIGAQMIPALAHARGMGNFRADVPRGNTVAAGDRVVLPPGNLLLGIVGTVEEQPSEPVMHVYFRTPFNISEIHSVEVLTHKK